MLSDLTSEHVLDCNILISDLKPVIPVDDDTDPTCVLAPSLLESDQTWPVDNPKQRTREHLRGLYDATLRLMIDPSLYLDREALA